MTWQDELRELDNKLAAGSVSADDYRLARDEILRQAHSGGTASASPRPAEPQAPQPSQTPSQQPPAAQPKPDPFGTPFKWDSKPPAGENTQMIRPAGGPAQGDESDRTQVVPNSPSGEATQIVPGPQTPGPWAVARPEHLPPGQQPGPAPWPPPPIPPWGNQDFESVVAPNSGWMVQGPETFEKMPSSNRKRVLGIVVAAVLVAGLVAAGVIYFVNSGSESANPGGTTGSTNPGPPPRVTSSARKLPEPPAAKGAPADNATALVDPPGTVRGGGGPLDLAALQSKKLLPATVVTALEQGTMKDGLLKTTSLSGLTIGMYVLTVSSEDDARAVAVAYGKSQRDGGLPPNENLALRGVPVYSTPDRAKDQVYRAVYVLYERVVIIETFGPDRDAVRSQFQDLLTQQVNLAPPSLREL